MKERITPKDDIEIYNTITNENTDKTEVLKWALCGKDYEDLEEQGLIVRLPCRVGDTVYLISLKLSIISVVIDYFECVLQKDMIYETYTSRDGKGDFFRFGIRDIGKTVFLTLEEAEKKLKELKGEEK